MNRPAFSQEARLLLATAGGPDAHAAIRTLLRQPLDWRRVVDLSLRETAQPVLSRRVRAAGGDLITEEVASALRQFERIAEFRALHLRNRLLGTLDVLSTARIPVVLLKGSALALTAYDSFADRPMADVDLLVEPERSHEALSLIRREGWERRFAARHDDIYNEMHHLPPLVDGRAPDLHLGLELHTDIIPRRHNPFAFSARQIWERAQSRPDLPAQVRVPCPTDLLLHCCIHYSWSHMFSRSAWRTIMDVSALTRTPSFDWNDFLDAAREARAETCCYWALRAAQAFGHVPIPAHALASLHPARSDFLLNLIEQHVRHEAAAGEVACPSVRLRKMLWAAAIQPGTSGHGRSRPWTGDQPWHEVKPAAATARATPVALLRYLRMIAQTPALNGHVPPAL